MKALNVKTLLQAFVFSCLSNGALANNTETALTIGDLPTLGILTGHASGTYTQMAQNLAEVVNDEGGLRLLVTLGGGSIQNIVDIIKIRGIDMAILQADVALVMESMPKEMRRYLDRIEYIAKLHSEEIHILAGPGIENMKQLEGKRVGFGSTGSGTSMTASIVFNSLDIYVKPQYLSNTEAVAAVRDGRLAAAVFVVGKPANYFDGISREDRLHILPIETDKRLDAAGYLSGRFEADDYPNLLMPPGGVHTITVAAVLAVYRWDDDHPKAKLIEIFTERFFRNLSRLQTGNIYHLKWREVDGKAELLNWIRSEPAALEALKQPR